MTGTLQNIIAGLSLGSLYALFALGVALIFGVAKIINFAHGSLIAMSAYILLGVAGLPWPIVVAATVLAGALGAVLLEVVAFRHARKADQTTQLIISFGLSVILQSALVLVAGSEARSVSFGQHLVESVSVLGLSVLKIDLITMAVAAVLMIGLTAVLRRTMLGFQLRAAAEDFRMARHLGVRADRVLLAAFAISGFLAGVAALLITIRSGTISPTMGLQPILVAFVATVIGGLGSLYGAAAGGMLLGLLTILLQVVLPASLQPYRESILFSAVIAVLLFRPAGIAGTSTVGARV